MKLIPYDKFKIKTALSPTEVAQRVRSCTGEKKVFSFDPSHEFGGYVHEKGFEITKNISYRNSFLPVIEGRIEQARKGSLVTIAMRLHFLTMLIMVMLFSCVGFVGIAMLTNMDDFSLPVLIPFGVLLFLVVLAGFWSEAPKQKRRLIALLKDK